MSADGEHIYIAAVDDNAIQVFSMKTMDIISRVPVGKARRVSRSSRDGRQAYVTNLNDGTVTILNLAGHRLTGGPRVRRGASRSATASAVDSR